MQRLHQGRKAVGGAGSVRDHSVRGLQDLVVHPVDDGRIDVLAARCRDDYLLRAGRQVRRGLLLAGEQAGALEHDVDLQVFPGQLGRIAFGAHLDPVAVYDHGLAFHRDRAGKFSVDGVVARQMRIGLRVAEVVDRDELQIVSLSAFIMSAQDVATYSSVPVDGDSNCHAFTPSIFLVSGPTSQPSPRFRR